MKWVGWAGPEKSLLFKICKLEANLKNGRRTARWVNYWVPKPHLVYPISCLKWSSGWMMSQSLCTWGTPGMLSTSYGLLSTDWSSTCLFTQPLIMGFQGHWHLLRNVVVSKKQQGVTRVTKHEWGFIEILPYSPRPLTSVWFCGGNFIEQIFFFLSISQL